MICLYAYGVAGAVPALKVAGITTSRGYGAIGIAPHCYNTADEMQRVTEVLTRRL
jgi:hypothetical protein